MEKPRKRPVIRLLAVVVLVQIIGFLFVCVLKYNMDVFLVNYRSMESKSYAVLLALDDIEADVYRHETLVMSYIMSDDPQEMRKLKKQSDNLKTVIENSMITCDAELRGLKGYSDYDVYDKAFGAVRAYLNCTDIAFDIKENNSEELARYLYDNNMNYYIDVANKAMDEMNDYVSSILDDTKKKMNDSMISSRVSFVMGVFVFFASTVFCMWYCLRVLRVQEYGEEVTDYEKK